MLLLTDSLSLGRAWQRELLGGAVVVALLAFPSGGGDAFGQVPPAAEPTAERGPAIVVDDGSPSRTGEGRLGSDASFFEAVLVHPASEPSVRRAAADRLVRDRTPEAMQAIERVLRGKSAETLAAVVEALDRADAKVPSLVDALVSAIASDRTIDRAAATRVLASSDARATELLGAAASRGELPARIGAIVGLGELRTRMAAGRLVAMLDPASNEPPAIVEALCAALARGTGASIGADPEAWRAWWEESLKAPLENGEDMAIRGRMEAAERALAEERRRGDRLAERLTDVYGQLFLRLTQKERMQRSGELLADSLPEVRLFAVTQIERLLRNGERAEDATLQAITVLLDDPLPTLRARGVRLLDDLASPDLAQRVAERLPRERDPAVRAAFLDALASQPSAEAFAAVMPLITDPVHGEAACRVLASLADAKLLPPEATARLLSVLRESLGARPNGPAAQLLAALGDDADISRVTALLDSSEPSIRRGAAEGLRRRGVRRPLLDRARDPAIFVPLMASLADEPRTLATLDQVIAVAPPAEAAGEILPEWNAAVARLIRELPVADLPAADLALERVPACETRTRLLGLGRFASAAFGGLRKADVELGLQRYVDMMAAQGNAREAIDLLAERQPKPDEPTGIALFRAHLLAGEFARAADMQPGASAWLNVLESVIADTPRARPIADEIALRFEMGASVSGGTPDGRARQPATPTERERFERLRKVIAINDSVKDDG